jgi:hypothetical protein
LTSSRQRRTPAKVNGRFRRSNLDCPGIVAFDKRITSDIVKKWIAHILNRIDFWSGKIVDFKIVQDLSRGSWGSSIGMEAEDMRRAMKRWEDD